jgi:hypothetical protein
MDTFFGLGPAALAVRAAPRTPLFFSPIASNAPQGAAAHEGGYPPRTPPRRLRLLTANKLNTLRSQLFSLRLFAIIYY